MTRWFLVLINIIAFAVWLVIAIDFAGETRVMAVILAGFFLTRSIYYHHAENV